MRMRYKAKTGRVQKNLVELINININKPSETADLADPRIRDEQFLTLIYVENDK